MLLTSAAHAQDLGIKAPRQQKPVAITNATIHPISSAEIPAGVLTFSEGKITGVYSAQEWQTFKATVLTDWNNWTLIDAAGKHVYPGMIAADTQLGLQEFAASVQTLDSAELGQVKPEVLAVTAVNPDSTLLPVTRSNGVLTAAIFPEGGLIPGRPCAIRLDAWTNEEMPLYPLLSQSSGRGARVREGGEGLKSPSGLPEGVAASSRTGEASSNPTFTSPSPALGLAVNWPMLRTIRAWWMDQSEEDQQKANRENLERVTQTFDTAAAYIAAKDADPSSPTDLRWEAMRDVLRSPSGLPEGVAASSPTGEASSQDPAIETTSDSLAPKTLPLFIAANDHDQIVSAIAFVKERGLRMVLMGGRDSEMCADLLRENDIPVVISGTHAMPRRDDAPYDEAFTLPQRLRAAGVRFCIASADRTAHERNLPYNAATAVAYGLPMDEALKAVTLYPAQILGLGDQLGSLEVGKAATLILTTGNPLEVTTQIESAYIDGRQIDLTNKQTRLYDKYRERFEQLGQIKDEYKIVPTPAKNLRK